MDPEKFGRDTQFFLGLGLAAMLFAVAIWDGAVLWYARPEFTVTALLQSWATKSPIVVLLAGIVLGHLFWPAHVP